MRPDGSESDIYRPGVMVTIVLYKIEGPEVKLFLLRKVRRSIYIK